MREVKYTARFQRDHRREKSGRPSNKLDALLMEVVNLLAGDTPLPRRNFDHPLSGEWNDLRDCHIRPDLVLIYRKPDDQSLEFVRLGSHSELGLCQMGRPPSLIQICVRPPMATRPRPLPSQIGRTQTASDGVRPQ